MLESVSINFKYIQLPVNSDLSLARNTAIRVSNCDNIAFLDDDDILVSAKLEILNRIVVMEMPDRNCLTYTEVLDNEDFFYKVGSLSKAHKYQSFPLWRVLLSTSVKISRTVIRMSSQCLYDENMRYCEDHDVWVRLIKNGNAVQVIVLPLTRLGRPRLSAGGLSGNLLKMRFGEAQVYKNFCHRRGMSRALLLPALLLQSLLNHVLSSVRK